MRRCHYTHDKEVGKVLIPGCMAVAHTNDIEDCTCSPYDSFTKFERDSFNKQMKEKIEIIKELEFENKRLINIIQNK